MDLVTGATGIVGAHLVAGLLNKERSVRAIVRSPAKETHLNNVLSHYGISDVEGRLETIDADILDVNRVRESVQGIENVHHAAAMVSFTPHERQLMWKVNVEGTANMVNASIDAGVRRFCHVSSVASIGRDPDGEISTEQSEFEEAPHVSPYSFTKYHAELEIQRGIAEGLDAFMVNPSVIVGPGIDGESSMAMVDKVRKGIAFHPSGTAAIVDARDVAEALITGVEKARNGERYLLVGEHLPYKELFGIISETAKVKPPGIAIPHWVLRSAAIFETARSSIFKSKPMVTKHTAHSACSHYRYDNAKALKELGMEFHSAKEAVENALRFRDRFE